MTAENVGAGSGCFKKGCLGCLAVVVLGVGGVLLLALLSWAGSSGPVDEQHREVERALPGMPALDGSGGVDELEAPEQGTLLLDGEAARELGLAESIAGNRSPVEPVTLALDLSMGEFVIEPGPADQPVRIEADYDQARFELEESFDPENRRYRVRFGKKGGLLRIFQFGETRNQVRIVVPRGYPLILVGQIAMGESRLELGGLGLEEVNLDVGVGSHRITFSEPTPQALRLFDVEGSMGELHVVKLGNASPRQTSLDLSMGSLHAGLEGAWRNDGAVVVECGMGECNVSGPGESAELIVERAEVSLGERTTRPRDAAPEGAPKVRLSVDSMMGEVRID